MAEERYTAAEVDAILQNLEKTLTKRVDDIISMKTEELKPEAEDTEVFMSIVSSDEIPDPVPPSDDEWG